MNDPMQLETLRAVYQKWLGELADTRAVSHAYHKRGKIRGAISLARHLNLLTGEEATNWYAVAEGACTRRVAALRAAAGAKTLDGRQ